MGKILAIFIAPAAGAPMQSVPNAAIIAGSGIAGDRYAEGTGRYSKTEPPKVRQVTFFSREGLEAANKELAAVGRSMAPKEMRRNIYVEGVDLNACMGGYLGNENILFEGFELATPCKVPPALAKWSREQAVVFEWVFAERGGLRAAAYHDAVASVDDPIRAMTREEARTLFPKVVP